MNIPLSYLIAKVCFSAAGLIFLIKFGTWISSEPYELKWRIIAAFVIFGAVGLGWVLSWHWVGTIARGAQEKEAKPTYAGRLQPEKKIILSGKDNIHPELEIGDSGAVLVWSGPQGIPMLKVAEDNEIKIESIKGQIQISTRILDRNGQMIAEIVENKWKVKPQNSWARNYSKNSLEVRDPTGDIVLQVRLVANRVQFQAKLFDSLGRRFCLISEGSGRGGLMGFNIAQKIQPIFKYPSELHLGEFAESQ